MAASFNPEIAMQPDCLILYVHSPAESVLFYRSLLGREPVEQSPNFAMFMLNDKTMLGLWAALARAAGADHDGLRLHRRDGRPGRASRAGVQAGAALRPSGPMPSLRPTRRSAS